MELLILPKKFTQNTDINFMAGFTHFTSDPDREVTLMGFGVVDRVLVEINVVIYQYSNEVVLISSKVF